MDYVDMLQAQIKIQKEALERIKEVLAHKPIGTFFRINILSGGCSGFSSSFVLDTNVLKDDIIIKDDNVKIVINKKLADFIKDATLCFYRSVLSSHFYLDIEHAKEKCSCGSSFSF